MKKLLLTAVVATAAAGAALAQGTIVIDNLENGNTSSTATSGGLFLIYANGAFTGYAGSLNLTVLGGPSAGSLSPIATLLNADLVSAGNGLYFDANGATYAVPGVTLNGTATLEVEAWTGSATSYAAAITTPGALYNAVIFLNPTGGGGIPPATPEDLVGMPAVLLGAPEPSTVALGGIGAAALFLFLRRNK